MQSWRETAIGNPKRKRTAGSQRKNGRERGRDRSRKIGRRGEVCGTGMYTRRRRETRLNSGARNGAGLSRGMRMGWDGMQETNENQQQRDARLKGGAGWGDDEPSWQTHHERTPTRPGKVERRGRRGGGGGVGGDVRRRRGHTGGEVVVGGWEWRGGTGRRGAGWVEGWTTGCCRWCTRVDLDSGEASHRGEGRARPAPDQTSPADQQTLARPADGVGL